MGLSRRATIWSLAALPATLSLAACGSSSGYQLSYRLQIAIVIAGTRCVGSAVEKIRWHVGGFLTGFDGVGDYSATAFAEAVIMQLGEKGLLFGLIFPPNTTKGFDARYVSDVFAADMPLDVQTRDAYRSGTFFKHLQRMDGKYSVGKDHWPALVRFGDIHDPKSAQIIAPEQLSAVYGPNSYVDDVSVEITHDPVTEQIDKPLPWLSQTHGSFSLFEGPASAAPDAAKLTRRCFRLDGEV